MNYIDAVEKCNETVVFTRVTKKLIYKFNTIKTGQKCQTIKKRGHFKNKFNKNKQIALSRKMR